MIPRLNLDDLLRLLHRATPGPMAAARSADLPYPRKGGPFVRVHDPHNPHWDWIVCEMGTLRGSGPGAVARRWFNAELVAWLWTNARDLVDEIATDRDLLLRARALCDDVREGTTSPERTAELRAALTAEIDRHPERPRETWEEPAKPKRLTREERRVLWQAQHEAELRRRADAARDARVQAGIPRNGRRWKPA